MNVKLSNANNLLLVCLVALIPVMAHGNTLERIRASHTFTLGYLPDFAPFSDQAADKASGYAIDLCLKIAERVKTDLGLPELSIQYQPVSMSDEMTAVSSGKIDILCTPTPPTLVRRKRVSYSVPIYTAGLAAVVRQDSSEALLNALDGKVAHTGPTWRATVNRGLSNQTYAAIAGGITETWIQQQMRLLGVVATLVTVENADAGLKLVADGKADAFFAERMMLKHLLDRNYPAGNLVVLERMFEYAPTAMAVDREDEDFRLLVDTALSEMYRSGEIEQAFDKYLGGASDAAKKLFKIYALP
ncbi:amino acid ABC transporter substrate-binding protein, PAAT family [Pseudomonas reinekei]|uniref:Amino acid ABC transporter substrate-binding protein n=1 Tax=Pseudomonas reinekei TaxID=395598 RepID=A0A1H0U2W6_PSERE|nr:amino acid ABC transporter substrate-binding protein [Pseudomonas reinekei]KAB0488062.1 amino acid ABC transporter substrate-binding protein [Pseudomonas reinekei]OLU05497.1 amino acid ABC transporter substrate-binding protein [Pseudomonas reinekei]SDP60529.1 amino acid ABC transporter substrate-binding protein, PAAT family [Pseudomonas reinekei]